MLANICVLGTEKCKAECFSWKKKENIIPKCARSTFWVFQRAHGIFWKSRTVLFVLWEWKYAHFNGLKGHCWYWRQQFTGLPSPTLACNQIILHIPELPSNGEEKKKRSNDKLNWKQRSVAKLIEFQRMNWLRHLRKTTTAMWICRKYIYFIRRIKLFTITLRQGKKECRKNARGSSKD